MRATVPDPITTAVLSCEGVCAVVGLSNAALRDVRAPGDTDGWLRVAPPGQVAAQHAAAAPLDEGYVLSDRTAVSARFVRGAQIVRYEVEPGRLLIGATGPAETALVAVRGLSRALIVESDEAGVCEVAVTADALTLVRGREQRGG